MAIGLKKSSSSSSSSSYLPLEIIEIILSKLPLKSLLRFKTVSKSWNTTIADPVFIESRLRSSPNNLFLSTYGNCTGGFSSVKLEGRKFHHQPVLENRHHDYDVVLCECNGVLLLSAELWFNSRRYVLWNPSTRREISFESPYNKFDGRLVNHGICYDPITDDFKVIVIGEKDYGVYSCKNNSRTTKESRFWSYSNVDPGIFVDGATYWVIHDTVNRHEIVCFDPRTDELMTLQKPENNYLDMSVACLRGKLCLYCTTRDCGTKIQIWIKEEGVVDENPRWKELITVENVPSTIRFCKPLCFVENEILFFVRSSLRYVFYNPFENTTDILEESCTTQFVPFRNSLYLQ